MAYMQRLAKQYPDRLTQTHSASDILPNTYYDYILTVDEQPVIVGHGKKNRAKVIFDSLSSTTRNHIKALILRLHHIYAPENVAYNRWLLRCDSKEEARQIEVTIHNEFGGNKITLPSAIEEKLFKDLPEESLAKMVIKMALCSSFDGLTDLYRWRQKGILDDAVWEEISRRLRLPSDES